MNAPLKSTQLANPFDLWFMPIQGLKGISMMDHLYNRLDGAYPHKWRSNFSTPEAIDNWKVSWAEAFEEEGITPQDIKAGLKACRTKYDWPPSCAEFIKACKPSVDPLVSYYEAVSGVTAREKGEMGEWSHPAVYWAAIKMAFDLKSLTYSAIKDRWNKALADEMAKGEWAAIPAPMVALPAPGKTELSKEKAAQMLQEIGASEVLKTADTKTDHKLWAKRILERHRNGDKSLTMIQVNFAKESVASRAM
ncbi:MAG TPA: replication protein P [Noviherbaspirillum sp.]|jgi:hypothetical protein|uniref:replication protein P n=1 Tax=Noviherbaspirillum sp. TaxID=1926288 RepID=UPI002DDD6CA8|nr:replication protein P [Noviherbaspirillum sp.]HEV2612521.1 replication protein P [Noviherbaspirillum sp.]